MGRGIRAGGSGIQGESDAGNGNGFGAGVLGSGGGTSRDEFNGGRVS